MTPCAAPTSSAQQPSQPEAQELSLLSGHLATIYTDTEMLQNRRECLAQLGAFVTCSSPALGVQLQGSQYGLLWT